MLVGAIFVQSGLAKSVKLFCDSRVSLQLTITSIMNGSKHNTRVIVTLFQLPASLYDPYGDYVQKHPQQFLAWVNINFDKLFWYEEHGYFRLID